MISKGKTVPIILNQCHARRKHQSPGKGAGQRALMAVCDKVIRMLYRILIDHAPYAPTKDQTIARYYAARRKAA